MNLSIVIPVYNEAENIGPTLDRITTQVDPPWVWNFYLLSVCGGNRESHSP